VSFLKVDFAFFVSMTVKAISKDNVNTTINVLVANKTAADRVQRFSNHRGYLRNARAPEDC